MGALLLICRLFLALVFLIAGVAKFVSRQSTREMLEDFGLPDSLVPVSIILLPLSELCVAVALFITPSARSGGVAALTLLGAFCVGIGVNLHFGRRPSCQCFGQLGSSPVSRYTIFRNLLLMALAGVVLWRPSAYTALALPIQQAALLLAVFGICLGLFIVFLLFQLTAQNGRILLAFEELSSRQPGTALSGAATSRAINTGVGLPIGSRAPNFQLAELSGRLRTLADLLHGGSPLLLTFVDPGCGPCHALLPSLVRWQHEDPRLRFILISRGTAEENLEKVANARNIPVLLQVDREVQQVYEALGTPSMLHVAPDGSIGSGVAQGSEQIGALVSALRSMPSPGTASVALTPQRLTTQSSPTNSVPQPDSGRVRASNHIPASNRPKVILQPGVPLPGELALKLNEAGADLVSYRGKSLLLLFWSSACGFCQTMLPDLRQWEATRSPGDPELIVIESAAAPPSNGNELHFPSIYDASFELGRAFSIGGTPSAVLLSSDGTVAGEIAVGRSAIMNLVSRLQVAE
ncbi:MauE/DoxX family redox-associated membrane protein [Tunturibacter psychrotolerans]|uniref:MauE/DoxX family redox-associated membrane protein n=1 Tax=Tunturiibacter psychrotolerans TaxID=3069686 RepID=A0AAU7ZPH4_9BACT